MLYKQKLFFNSKSGEKVIPLLTQYCVYILSRNREKQLSVIFKNNKDTQEAILKACVSRNTATLLVTVTVDTLENSDF
jgi:hypothetical protein